MAKSTQSIRRPIRHRTNVLTQKQIEQFVEQGFVILRGAFPRRVAQKIRESLWQELGLNAADPKGWKQPFIHIPKIFTGPPFTVAFTARLHGAFDDLMGAGRWNPIKGLGWWPVSFPGFDRRPWHPPTTGWHIDGIQFHHHVHSRDQGLLPIFILSDIGSGDGGTAIDLGSHKITARILNAAEPAGLEVDALCRRVAKHPFHKIIETNGRAGDVALMHPFMRHARSPNTGKSVRFICNPCITLKRRMNLKRRCPEDYSPVERAIVKALR